MTTKLFEPQAATAQRQVMHYANELMDMVRARHADAQFYGPTYWPTEQLWIIDAFFDQGEDFDLQEQLSEREMDILLAEDLWLCVLPIPFSLYTQ